MATLLRGTKQNAVASVERVPESNWQLWDIGSNNLSSATVAARWITAANLQDLRLFDHALTDAEPLSAALSTVSAPRPCTLRSLDLGGGSAWGDAEALALVAGMRAAVESSPGASLEVLSLAGSDGVSSVTADAIADARKSGMSARIVVDAAASPTEEEGASGAGGT